jgi:hypothetical protein
VVLQTQIFFLVADPEKKVGLYYKPTFFQVGEKWFRKLRFFFLVGNPEKNPSLQNHFSVTLKITSNGAD